MDSIFGWQRLEVSTYQSYYTYGTIATIHSARWSSNSKLKFRLINGEPIHLCFAILIFNALHVIYLISFRFRLHVNLNCFVAFERMV